MAFRYILVTKPARLSLKDNCILIAQDEHVTVPLEDINAIIIDETQVTITVPLLSKCMEFEVAIFYCNDQHLPIGISLPFQSHSKQHHRIYEQLNMGKPFQKRLWQKIIIQKILNQSRVLEIKKVSFAEYLEKLTKKVDSGDTNNTEAMAAKLYFREIFGNSFIRHSKDCINIALDYGYSIIRGVIARTLVAYGLIPSLGIKHCNQNNNFNLADDFIEPLRPMVDLFVSNNVKSSDQLSPVLKAKLVDLMNHDVLMGGQKITVTNAIDIMIKSFVSAIKEEDFAKIILPEIINPQKHFYE